MPPALSHTGPYASMVRPVASVDSMPIAARATPVPQKSEGTNRSENEQPEKRTNKQEREKRTNKQTNRREKMSSQKRE